MVETDLVQELGEERRKHQVVRDELGLALAEVLEDGATCTLVFELQIVGGKIKRVRKKQDELVFDAELKGG